MSCYSDNLAALFQRNAALAKRLHAVTPAGVRTTESRNGLPNLMEEDATGVWNALHSAYDPLRESRDRAATVVLNPDSICVVLGFGAGYLLEALLERDAAINTRFLVIEPNPSVFKEAMRCRDLRGLISCPAVDFHIGVDLELLTQVWESLPPARRMQPPRVVQHFASVKSHARFYHAALELIKRQASKTRFEVGNLANCSRLFFDNLIENLPTYMSNPGVQELKGLFENIPAILISAGPSLDKNIHLLDDVANSAVLIAVDAAVKPLLAKGIEPHFVLSVDPQMHNGAHLGDVRLERSRLVLEASVYPKTMRQFAGRQFVAALEGSFYQFLLQQLKDKGELRGWGSVATLAFDFARRLGCDPIIFLGQDLSFTGGRTYCDNITYQPAWLQDLNDENDLMGRRRNLLHSQDPVPAVDVFGGETLTTPRLLAYAHWLSSEIQSTGDVRCINATEGGILTEGTELMSLKEALFRHCQKEHTLWERIPSSESRSCSTEKLEKFVHRTIREISCIKEECQSGTLELDHWVEGARLDSPDSFIASSQQWWEQFQRRAFRYADTARILEYFNQAAIQEFLRATHPDELNAEGICRRYRQFVTSIVDCANYVEVKLEELDAMLRSQAMQASIQSPGHSKDRNVPKSGAK